MGCFSPIRFSFKRVTRILANSVYIVERSVRELHGFLSMRYIEQLRPGHEYRIQYIEQLLLGHEYRIQYIELLLLGLVYFIQYIEQLLLGLVYCIRYTSLYSSNVPGHVYRIRAATIGSRISYTSSSYRVTYTVYEQHPSCTP